MQKGISSVLIISSIVVVSLIGGVGYYFFNQQKLSELSPSGTNSITDFESCAKYYPVMLSYPGQCRTPDGRHFVQELSEEEKKKLIPPSPNPSSSPMGSLLQVCPEAWIKNEMPCVYQNSPDECNNPKREYYILEGERREIAEFDASWVQDNCQIEPEKVY